MLLYRVISAVVGIPLLLFFLWQGEEILLLALSLLIFLAMREIRYLLEKSGIKIFFVPALVGAWLLLWGSGYAGWPLSPLVALVVAAVLAMTVFYFPRVTIAEVGGTLLAIFYAGWTLTHFYLLRQGEDGFARLLFLLVTIWTTDIMAYFIGRAVGRHKLAPPLSPGKTWEGLLGGMAGAVVAAEIFNRFHPVGSPGEVITTAALIAVLGQVGDLFESALKRMAGVKDSGRVIPGHGGVLDRFDSLFFVLPLFYYFFPGQ